MSTGDRADFSSRIKSLLPTGWFRDETPVLDAVLGGIGSSLSDAYGLSAYARLQTRIASATDAFLDLISFDFFGGLLPRRSGESDAAFRTRIQAQLLLERGTRKGLVHALELLTGRTPIVFEPARIADTGHYNGGAYYGYSGQYGSVNLPFQTFVIAYRPAAQITTSLSGYNNPEVAYGRPDTTYTNLSLVAAVVTDQDILDLIDAVKPVGSIVWVRIES
jgi:hypothetical protein